MCVVVALLAKLIGFAVWVLTFIDYYPDVPVGVRYFLCLFPNTGLMFCLQVVLQYERKGGESNHAECKKEGQSDDAICML